MNAHQHTSSNAFEGETGHAVPAAAFPSANYIRDRQRFENEGDWVFCLLEGPDVHAARFGLTTGPVDYRDFGARAKLPSSNLQIHIELLTRDGGVLWHGSGLYDGRNLRSASDRVDMQIDAGDKTMLDVQGWPHMTWSMQCPDDDVSVRVEMDLDQVIILPDAVFPNMTFSMWLATAAISGQCTIDGRTLSLKGKAFYDHPRIVSQKNSAAEFGFYHYTPTLLDDGSQLISYCARHRDFQWNHAYSFAYWVRPGLPMIPLRSVSLNKLFFDEDYQPQQWRQRWEGDNITIEAHSTVTPTPIARLWGGPQTLLTRMANPLIPLVFDSALTIEQQGKITHARGRGLAEFVAHPEMTAGLYKRD